MKFGSLTFDGRGLNEILARPFGVNLIAWCIFLSLVAARPSAQAEPLQEARVSHVIKDVRLLATNAAPRPASVNDNVRQGTAVRTGADSRAELTFSDLTITRIGQNTVFSFKGGSREVTLDSGAILLQVPKGAEAAKIRTAAVTASITGGTALMNANSGYPTKLYIMEGTGELCLNSGECVTAHGGEMVLEDNGQLAKPVKFNAKLLFKTSPLLTGFPPLPNEALFFEVFDQNGEADSSPPPQKDPIDIVSQVPTPGPTTSVSPPSDKFGPPSTISSPDPYVISSGTQINTDPMITTNGVTDQGKLYRGTAVDGFPTQYLFGEAPTAFDQMVFAGSQNNLPIAIFKFAHLELTGDPTVTIPSGATTFLGLVSVGDITSGGPGGTLTFAGITRLSMITQAGSITLGPEIGFANLSHLEMYARGAGSNLTLGSAISNVDVVKLYAGGSIQVNGNVSTTEFDALSEGDFLAGTGVVTTTNVTIQSLANVNIDASKYPDFTGDANFVAGDTLSISGFGGGTFSGASLTGSGTTINLQGSGSPATFDMGAADVSFTAGSGGIQASNILFTNGNSLLLQTTNGGDINIYGIQNSNNGGVTVMADGAFDAQGDISTADLVQAGTSITIGGNVAGLSMIAGTTINVGGDLLVVSVSAGGDVTADHVIVLTLNAPNGVLTAGSGGITPYVTSNGAGEQHTFTVSSIVSPNGIDFSGNQFGGLAGLSSGGLLTVNANTLTFDSATGVASANFNGADSGAFGGGEPAEGGDGGIFIVNATGNITANNGADITATTGLNSDAGVYSGAGGSVTLHSTGGMVTVNDTIQVSSDDGANQRQSASGGTILLQSDLTTGSGITVGANAQLLSLLNTNAPGPGGSITLSTMGSDITVNGTIEADRGTITIDQKDPAGTIPTITIDGATLTSDTVNIEGAGAINIGLNNPVTINSNELELQILNELDAGVPATSGGTIAGDSTINVSESALSTGGLLAFLLNENDQGGTGTAGGHIDGSASITMNITGALTANGSESNSGLEPGTLELFIDNYGFGDGSSGGFIGSDASVSIVAASISSAGDFAVGIANDGGGTIGGAARLSVTAGSMSVDEFSAGITNGNFTGGAGSLGGQIAGAASITFNITGALTVAGGTDNDGDEPSTMSFVIDNFGFGDGSPAGSIGSDASIDITAGSISDDGRSLLLEISNSGGGMIGGNASITVTTTGSISAAGPGPTGAGENLNLLIDNSSGGSIGKDATVKIQTASLSAAQDFVVQIVNTNGTIGGKAALTLNATGDVNAAVGRAFFGLFNNPGAIESDASVDVGAANLTAGSFFEAFIENIGGTIGGNATVQVGIPGDLNAAHLFVVIDSSSGGSVGGNETINMNVSGTATVNNEATVQMLGPDPTGSAAINFNGGTYEIGGTFFNTIGGNGTITFNNTDIHANVVQAGVFGANGSLMIGGGSLSADTVLKLYAPGSSGTLHFTADVSLSSGTAMHLAANTITIDPGFTVSIGGAGGAANIYTNHPNYNFTPGGGYMGPPPNMANGSFGGTNGALDPVPLASAPTFGAGTSVSSPTVITNVGRPLAAKSGTPLDGAINISSTGQLLALLDTAVTGPGGKVTIPGPNSARNSGRPGRIYAESDLEADRGARQTTSSATGKLNYAGANNPQPLNHAPPVGPPGI
jgi:hypothetical protein